ncbi:hypothetical protein QBC47DRAFT_463266 [Echria macrotheca]|uniref:MYND-type domain-containing protein n=1 Tax=Echria macrotheca TaxID=438768 RepID=A0AAJ0B965_9PEZI|nr:hypothetical protein QBC47DRAFT_463266 [Echria macrotheca]
MSTESETTPSAEWPAYTRDTPFRIRLPKDIVNLRDLVNPSIKELCQANPSINRRCYMCDEDARPDWSCQTCSVATYCSERCRHHDLRIHGLVCRLLPAHIDNDLVRPSKQHFQAIVFPAQDKKPITCWVKMDAGPYNRGPASLEVPCPEFWSLATQFDRSRFGGFRLGSINASSVLRHRRLGKGLFVLEWQLNHPDNTTQQQLDGTQWANRSIAALGKPGQIWYYTGPILILALDPDLSLVGTNNNISRIHLQLHDITHRDFRSIADFFQMHPRNPCLTDPFTRIPQDIRWSWALKLNDTRSPLARAMGVTRRAEVVKVLTHHPATHVVAGFEGVSALLHGFGLRWVFRAGRAHPPEFDWMYSPQTTQPAGGNDKKGWPGWSRLWRMVCVVSRGTGGQVVDVVELDPLCDSIIMLHATGCLLWLEHLQALMEYIPFRRGAPVEVFANAMERIGIGRAAFKRFWELFKHRTRVDCPESPLETERENGICRVRLCRDTIRLLGVEETSTRLEEVDFTMDCAMDVLWIVPWIMLMGDAMGDAMDHLERKMCKTYDGRCGHRGKVAQMLMMDRIEREEWTRCGRTLSWVASLDPGAF